MRPAPLFALLLALSVVDRAAASTPSAPPSISIVWPAPAGHFQPRASDSAIAVPVSPSRAEQELDEKLKICRGC